MTSDAIARDNPDIVDAVEQVGLELNGLRDQRHGRQKYRSLWEREKGETRESGGSAGQDYRGFGRGVFSHADR